MANLNYDFKGQNIYIGIDVHLKSWSVCAISETNIVKKISTDATNIHELTVFLEKHFPKGNYLSVYESGFTGYSTHYTLEAAGIKNIIVNAADVPSTQKETLNKTDKVDAAKLAKSLKKGELTAIHVPTKGIVAFREMVRTRRTIVDDGARTKIRIRHMLHRNGVRIPLAFQENKRHWTKAFKTWLREDVCLIGDKETKEALMYLLEQFEYLHKLKLKITRELRHKCQNGEMKTNYELLFSVPGVGFVTAITILSELGDISRFSSNEKLASYVGLVPTCHNSGEKVVSGDISFRGNNYLRKVIVEAAWSAISQDPALGAKHYKLTARMSSNKATIRIAKCLLCRIKAVLTRQTKYIIGKNDQLQNM